MHIMPGGDNCAWWWIVNELNKSVFVDTMNYKYLRIWVSFCCLMFDVSYGLCAFATVLAVRLAPYKCFYLLTYLLTYFDNELLA